MNETKAGVSRRTFLKGAAAAAFLSGFGFAGCSRQSTPSLRILWTADSHGHLMPIYHREPFGEDFLKEQVVERGSEKAYLSSQIDFPELAKKYGKVGGYAHLATLIQRERSAYPDRTLLLDGGDSWYGSAIALLTEGKAPVQVMNAIGYDAMTLHWEFNLGKEALLARIKESKFAVLAQNLVDTDFEDRVLPASIVKELGGIKVGVIGQAYPFSMLTTELRDVNPGWRMGYREEDLQKEIDRLRSEEGVQFIILLSHMGYEQDRIIAGLVKGVNVIVGSHTHDILWQPAQVGETLIVHGGSHGKLLGELDVQVNNGKVEGFQYNLIPVLAQSVEPDAKISALIDELYQPHKEKLQKVVGETQSVLYRRSVFGGTTDAFMVKAYREIGGAQVGCAPGWRFGTTLLPGPVTFEDVYNAMKPTPSPLYKVKLSGRQIRLSIEDNLDNALNPDPLQRLGGDVLRCGGVKGVLTRSAPRDQRLSNITISDAPLQEDTKYMVATSGGRTQYLDPESQASPRPAVEELLDFIQKSGAISSEPIQSFTEGG